MLLIVLNVHYLSHTSMHSDFTTNVLLTGKLLYYYSIEQINKLTPDNDHIEHKAIHVGRSNKFESLRKLVRICKRDW